MSYEQNPYQSHREVPVIHASGSARKAFIRKTYVHLLGAVLACMGFEYVLFASGAATNIMGFLSQFAGNWGMLIVLGAFIGSTYLADRMAVSSDSLGVQYAGLALGIVAWSLILVPGLYIAAHFGGAQVIPTAAIVTGALFAGLTGSVFISGKNLSFMGPFLGIAMLGALALIVCSILFGFSLGVLFTVAMILLACGYILYDTSRVLHEYHTTQHVAAALALFSSVAFLFLYILRFLNSRN